MLIWLPVYQYEGKYEVNIIDGLVRYKMSEDDDREIFLEHVAIESYQGAEPIFHGYGVNLVDKDNKEHLIAIDKLVAEAIQKRTINKPIFHKNGLLIDCNYKNLTLTPPPKSEAVLKVEEATKFYQYKRIKGKNGECEKFVLDKVYKSYSEFSEKTGLVRGDFHRQKERPDQITIGIYLWTVNELKTRKDILTSTPVQRFTRAI